MCLWGCCGLSQSPGGRDALWVGSCQICSTSQSTVAQSERRTPPQGALSCIIRPQFSSSNDVILEFLRCDGLVSHACPLPVHSLLPTPWIKPASPLMDLPWDSGMWEAAPRVDNPCKESAIPRLSTFEQRAQIICPPPQSIHGQSFPTFPQSSLPSTVFILQTSLHSSYRKAVTGDHEPQR